MEFWDVYDRDGNKKNKLIARGNILKWDEYHIVVEGWIKVDKDKFIIQKRSALKKKFPGMWYCSVSGAVIAGEEPLQGLIRETKEELGLDIFPDNISLYKTIREHNAIFYIYLVEQEINLEDIILQEEEVSDVAIVDYKSIQKLIDKKEFIKLKYYKDFFQNHRD